jgi:hypothetical protein
MTHSPAPFTFTLPDVWTPEQAWIIHAFLADLLKQIEAHYDRAVQQWLSGEDPEEEAYRERQGDLFEASRLIPRSRLQLTSGSSAVTIAPKWVSS